jgi:hypothetical protein
MRQPHLLSHKRLMDEVYADPVRAALATEHTLTIADEPFTAEGLRSFSSNDGAARAIEGSLTAAVRDRHIGRRVRVDVFVEGVRYKAYWGWCLTNEDITEEDDSLVHTFGGATSGYWQNGDDAVRFNTPTSYPGWPPSRVGWDLMRRLPYERIAIPPVNKPEFNRVGADKFSPLAAIGEGLGAIEEQSSLRFRDNGADWGMGYVRPTLASPVDPVANWRYGEHLVSLTATRRNTARYFDVAIVRQLSDGSYEDLVTPRPQIRYKPGIAPPPVGTTYYEVMPDEDAVAPDSEYYYGAQSRAFVLTQSLGAGEYDMEVTTIFLDPRIEDYDIINATYEDWDTGALYRYRMLILSHDQDYTGSTATYRGIGALVDVIEPATLRAPARARSAGIVRATPSADTTLYAGSGVYPGGGLYPS